MQSVGFLSSQHVSTMSFTRDCFSAAFTFFLPVFGTIYKLVLTSLGFGRAVESILSRVNVEDQFFFVTGTFKISFTVRLPRGPAAKEMRRVLLEAGRKLKKE